MSKAAQSILKQLLNAKGNFVSGADLAKNLNVSRVSIWSQIEKLRQSGFKIESRRGLGYRLRELPEKLDPTSFHSSLPEKWRHVPVFFHQTIDSTNSEAERLLAAKTEAPFIVAAQTQSAGRGRLGRGWFSSDSGNLYLTFVFQPKLPPRRMQTFTLWMGLSICLFLKQTKNIPARLKWPNDLLLNGKKFAGMLTEARIDHDRIRDLVFGIGLNVNSRPADFPPEIAETATSLAESGNSFPLNEFAAETSAAILDGVQSFLQGKHETKLQTLWKNFDALAGLPVTARQGIKTFTGIASGIDESGSLLLRQEDGSLARVTAGDVTLRKN